MVVSWFQCPKSNIEEKQGRIRAGRQTSTAAEKVQTWGRRGRRARERGEWGHVKRNTKRNREKSALVGKQHSQREKRILERVGVGAPIWKTVSVMERPTTEGTDWWREDEGVEEGWLDRMEVDSNVCLAAREMIKTLKEQSIASLSVCVTMWLAPVTVSESHGKIQTWLETG